jgi:hypothetical protein
MKQAWIVVASLVVAGCHSGPAGAPKPAEAPAPKAGHESSEAVARAYARALNEGTLEDGLALFPSEAVVASVMTCTGPNALAVQVAEQRKQLTEQHGKLQKLLKEQKLAFAYVGPGEVHTKKKGTVEDGCTLQVELEAHEEFLRFEPESKAMLLVARVGDRFYLIHAPK